MEEEKENVGYVVVEVRIEAGRGAHGIDAFHKWRRFVNRPSNKKMYGVTVTDWRIFGKLREVKSD